VTVEEFGRMVDAGAFEPDARVELVDGELVAMSPIGVGHAHVVSELARLLGPPLQDRAVIRVQCPLQCGDVSQPQPDIAVLRWPPDTYSVRHPNADDALLVVEVADSSLRYDENVKVPLYASAGVREVWLADLPNRRIHVFTDPEKGVYTRRSVRRVDDVLRLVEFPEVKIVLADLRLDRVR
jgi:Uma2 family endonuclease